MVQKRTPILVLAAVGALLLRVSPLAAAAAPTTAHIVPFGAYGTPDGLVIRGRVYRGDPVPDKPWRGTVHHVWSTAGALVGHSLHFAHVCVRDRDADKAVEV